MSTKITKFFPNFRENLREHQYIILYKTDKNLEDDWSFLVNFPNFAFGIYKNDYSECEREYYVSFPTKIRFNSSKDYFAFHCFILGFGISVGHQTGY